jgi:hypothetical protein
VAVLDTFTPIWSFTANCVPEKRVATELLMFACTEIATGAESSLLQAANARAAVANRIFFSFILQ